MVVRISDKTQNYSKVTKLLVKPKGNDVEGLCQRIHAYIRKLSFPFDLDVSIGCAPYHKDIHKWNDWFIEADKQLYNEKKKLKDR